MLRDKAANGESFLIIGRCGDQVLKGAATNCVQIAERLIQNA